MSTQTQAGCPVPESGGVSARAGRATGKPLVAIFSLTGCEGCSLAILELEDQLLSILGAVEIVNFREGMSERAWDIDLGFVDGAVSTPHDEAEARRFRESCRTLVAIGACACLGGINTLKHRYSEPDYRAYVYADGAKHFPTTEARPLSAVVKVDYELPGCPLVREEFLRFVTCVLAGRPFHLPTYPVCVECKRRGTLCMYERGRVCLGPVTRAGCDAICPAYGTVCEACRGLLDEQGLAALSRNVGTYYRASARDVVDSLQLFGARQKGELP